jgi:hypothetical protein
MRFLTIALYVILAAVVGLTAYAFYYNVEREPVTGVVREKHYKPYDSSTGVGMDGNAVVTTNSSGPTYTLLINDEFLSVSKQLYLRIDVGDSITIHPWREELTIHE